ncbi:MAG: transposase, partial [Prolixibacteraceae bacterium]|nr:transposase [Prolixibacteraceae bacterium]
FGNSLSRAKKNYYVALRKYRLAFDKVLHNSKAPTIMLTAKNNRAVLEEALNFWEGKRLKNHAWCIMSNHFHWVLSVFEKDKNGNPVYLQDILHSVKLYSSRRINKNENRKGQLWMHESFETTIRDNSHFVRVVNYTINNPVSAKLVTEWQNWPGTFCEPDFPKTVGKTRS